MAVGFVLITVSPLKEKEAFEKISNIEEIKEIYPLFGEYDILAKVEAEDIDQIGSIV
ncbi:MAG: Lrp/AsnC family transcriptional regulator, partial [Thermotogae bacterium]